MYDHAIFYYSQNQFPFIFACIYHKNMVIFSMSWRCLNKETLQAYVQKPPSAPGYGVLVQSTQAESFATIEKLKVLLQLKR